MHVYRSALSFSRQGTIHSMNWTNAESTGSIFSGHLSSVLIDHFFPKASLSLYLLQSWDQTFSLKTSETHTALDQKHLVMAYKSPLLAELIFHLWHGIQKLGVKWTRTLPGFWRPISMCEFKSCPLGLWTTSLYRRMRFSAVSLQILMNHGDPMALFPRTTGTPFTAVCKNMSVFFFLCRNCWHPICSICILSRVLRKVLQWAFRQTISCLLFFSDP